MTFDRYQPTDLDDPHVRSVSQWRKKKRDLDVKKNDL